MSPTASPENAFKMTADLKPEVAITMHGSEKQKRQFEQKVKEAMPKTAVLIIEPFSAKTILLSKKPKLFLFVRPSLLDTCQFFLVRGSDYLILVRVFGEAQVK